MQFCDILYATLDLVYRTDVARIYMVDKSNMSMCSLFYIVDEIRDCGGYVYIRIANGATKLSTYALYGDTFMKPSVRLRVVKHGHTAK